MHTFFNRHDYGAMSGRALRRWEKLVISAGGAPEHLERQGWLTLE